MLRRTLLTLGLILVLLPSIMLGLLLYTEAGLDLVIRELWRIPGVSIHVASASGRLAGPLEIEKFELDEAHVHIVADHVSIELEPTALLSGLIRLRSLAANNLIVTLKATLPTSGPPSTPHFLPRSMRIRVDSVDIRGARFVYHDGAPIAADHVMGGVDLTQHKLEVRDLNVESALADLAGRLAVQATRPLGIALDAELRSPTPRGPNIIAALKLNGTSEKLNVQGIARSPSAATVDALLETNAAGWNVTGSISAPSFSFTPWLEKPPLSLADAALKVHASAQGVDLQGSLTVPELQVGAMRVAAKGNYSNRVLRIDQTTLAAVATSTKVTASGQVQFNGTMPNLDVTARWSALQWPLRGSALVSSDRGAVTLVGAMPYRYQISGAFRAPHVTVDDMLSKGTITKESLDVESFELKLLEGTARGKGSLNFSQPRVWTVELQGNGLNPRTLNAKWPGQIDLTARARGEGIDSRAQFQLDLIQLHGKLQEQPLAGSGSIERSARGWRAHQARLSLGRAHAAIDGKFEDTLDIDWSLQALDLAKLSPILAGRIDSSGHASGSRQSPRIVGDLRAAGLRYGEWKAAILSAKVDVDVNAERSSHFTVSGEDIGSSQPQLHAVRITGEGSAAANTITVEVEGALPQPGEDARSAKAVFAGRLQDLRWTGNINILRVQNDAGAPFQLANPAALRIARDSVSAGQLCLVRNEARLCGQGEWQKEGAWKLDASAQDVPLSLFESNHNDETRLEGQLRADVHAAAAAGKPWEGKASLDLIDGIIRYQFVNGVADTVNLGNGHVEALVTSQQATAHLHLATPQNSVIDAHGALDRSDELPLLRSPLSAVVHAHTAEAKLLPMFVADIDRAAGELDADVQIAGSLAAPQLSGVVELKGVELDVYRLNLALRELSAQVKLNTNEALITGSAKAGEGTLQVNGAFAWHDGRPSGSLHLQGKQLLVADLPEYKVIASPNLDFKIDANKIDATGIITIPSARITPKDLSGAVQVSSDARLVNDQRANRGTQFAVSSDVRIEMGDDVRLDTFGLQAKLGGNVRTLLRPAEPPVGRGELSVSEGRYTAYGQKLEIKRGRLLYELAPLDDPGLDVQAERTVEQITVGVNVRGTLRAPTLQFYSDPPMSQSQIVSYLIIGKPLENLQGQEAATVNSVRNSVALQGGGFLVSQLGHRIGLEEVGVETTTNATTNTTTTSLVLGKFLSPRLFISYGISLTEAINTLKLRYTVSDHWVLKTEAGQRQGADIEYTIER